MSCQMIRSQDSVIIFTTQERTSMSTLMSVDMNIERSSTRLHAPPGGKTSICFGEYDTSQNYPTKAAPTSRRHQTGAKSSMSDLLSPRNTEEEEEDEEIVKKMPTSNSAQMAGIFSENVDPKPAVRVRQAPGGRSSLVLG